MDNWTATKTRNFWSVRAPDGRTIDGITPRAQIGQPARTEAQIIEIGKAIAANRGWAV